MTVDLDRRNVLDTFLKDTFINYNHIVICLKSTLLRSSFHPFFRTKKPQVTKAEAMLSEASTVTTPSLPVASGANVGIRWACLFPGGLPKNMPIYPTYPNVWGLLPVSI